MYSQPVQPQAPYQVPYLQPVGTPNQGDSLDQAAKLIDLVERISQRGAGNLAPGTSQYSPLNAGQFQTRTAQELAAQEMALRNLSNSNAASQYQPGVAGNEAYHIKQSIQGSLNAFATQSRLTRESSAVSDSLMTLVNRLLEQVIAQSSMIELGAASNQVSNAFSRELNAAYDVIALGDASHNLANAFSRELNAAYDLICVLEGMLNSPLFLLHQSFEVFKNTIQPGDTHAIDLISGYYLDLVRSFEEATRASTGQYTPQYSQYLQGQVNSNPFDAYQITPQVSQAVDMVTSFAEGLRTPDFAQRIKRAHTVRNGFR